MNFLLGNKKILVITGPAGTGKTTLIRQIQKKIFPVYQKSCHLIGLKPLTGCMVTATTNKAAALLQERTIHSYLGLTVRNDYKTGKTYLQANAQGTMLFNVLIIIDECSMVDDDLWDYLMNKCNAECKFIFVGDKNQLPPVNAHCPVFDNADEVIELDKIWRFADPDLLDLSHQLQEIVESKVFSPIRIPSDSQKLLWLNPDAFQVEIDKTFKNRNPRAKILCYTNQQAIAYNEYVAKLRGDTYYLTKNNSYTVNNYTHAFLALNKHAGIDETKSLKFFSGNEVVVKRVLAYRKRGLIDAAFLPGWTELDYLMVELNNYPDYWMIVPKIPELHEQLLKHLEKTKQWKRYFFYKETVADLRPDDAITIHKAQGSTFNEVFVDLNDLFTCKNPDIVARLFYVACTRGADRVVLCGSVPSKFGGIYKD